jgi:hypothetical protein
MNAGTVRDIAIIVLALESIVIGALLIFLILQVRQLITTLQRDIRPLIDSTNETVSTVRGTTQFMSRHLVTPVVRVASVISGAKRASQVLTGRSRNDPDTLG